MVVKKLEVTVSRVAMEPVSATVGLVAGLTQIIENFIIVVDFAKDLKDGAAERSRLRLELRVLSELLIKLEDGSKHTWLTRPEGPLDQFRSALEALVGNVVTRHGIRRSIDAVSWPYTKKQVNKLLDQVERVKSIIDISITEDISYRLEDIAGQVETIQRNTVWLREEASHVSTLLNLTQTVRVDTESIKRLLEEKSSLEKIQDCRIIADWISASNYALEQANIIRKWQKGTGLWFFNLTEFEDFCNTPSSTLLCTGIPGAGKSMIAALTVQYFWQRFQDNSTTPSISPVATIFCSYGKRTEQTVHHMLAAILKQVVQGMSLPPEIIRQLYDLHSTRGSRPSKDELVTTLRSILRGTPPTFIVVDALDECNATDRRELAEILFDLQNDCDIRILSTSRDVVEVTELFPAGVLKSTIRATTADIRVYLEPRLSSLGRFIKRDTALQHLIIDKVTTAADGMYVVCFRGLDTLLIVKCRFLLARLHMESLKGRTSPRGLEVAASALHAGQETLEIAYKSVLARIDDQPAPLRDLAHRAIAWVVCAKRELTAAELREALSVNSGDVSLDQRSFPDIELVIDACAGLITLDDIFSVQYVRLAHHTTTEFLREHLSKWVPDANAYLTEVCATYLFFNLTTKCEGLQLESILASHHMLEYVHENWARHFQEASYAQTSEKLLKYLLDDHLWHRVTRSAQGSSWAVQSAHRFNGLHLAAQKGLHMFVPRLMFDRRPRNRPDETGRTPLSYAAENGHLDVVRQLTQLSRLPATFEVKDSRGLTPLLYALHNGHTDISDHLFRRMKGYATRSNDLSVSLIEDAIAKKGDEMLRLVLQCKDINVNSKNSHGQPMLHKIVQIGNKAMVRAFLAHQDIDVNVKGLSGLPVLHLAVKMCTLTVRRRSGRLANRLSLGASVPKSEVHPTFSLTTSTKPTEIVRLLIARNDIDLNAQNEKGATVLHMAVDSCKKTLNPVLGSQENEMPGFLTSGLRMGSFYSYSTNRKNRRKLIKILLNCTNLDPNILNKEQDTPLHMAVSLQDKRALRALLKCKNIQVNTIGQGGRTPLHEAAMSNYSKGTKWLLSQPDIDINFKDAYGATPLHKAVSDSSLKAMKRLLLRSEIDVNAKASNGWTALHTAASRDLDRAVKLLLSHPDIDVNAKSSNGWTALHMAAHRNHAKTASVLLAHPGIEADVEDCESFTPLLLAIKRNSLDVAKSLIEDEELDIQTRAGPSIYAFARIFNNSVTQLILDTIFPPNRGFKRRASLYSRDDRSPWNGQPSSIRARRSNSLPRTAQWRAGYEHTTNAFSLNERAASDVSRHASVASILSLEGDSEKVQSELKTPPLSTKSDASACLEDSIPPTTPTPSRPVVDNTPSGGSLTNNYFIELTEQVKRYAESLREGRLSEERYQREGKVNAWIDSLGDLSRYRMSINDENAAGQARGNEVAHPDVNQDDLLVNTRTDFVKATSPFDTESDCWSLVSNESISETSAIITGQDHRVP